MSLRDQLLLADTPAEIAAVLDEYIGTNLARLSTDASGNTALVDAAGNVLIRPVVSYTWANLPAAGSNIGVTVRVSDYGGGAGSLWISDGTYWVPASGRVTLGSGYTPSACTGTAGADEVLGTFTVPASMMGTKGRLRIMHSWNLTGVNAGKNMKINFGAMLLHSATEAAAATRSGRLLTEVQNRSNASSQIAATGQGNSFLSGFVNAALNTGTVNTAADVVVTITGSRANAGDTCVLESWIAELLVP